MVKIAVLTPTGDRRVALNRCSYYICRQTKLPDYWIITDDGKEPYKPATRGFFDTIYTNRPPSDKKAKSFTGNLINGIEAIPEDTTHVIMFEDDDWYSPVYIEKTMERFETGHYKLIGQNRTIYYQIHKRAFRENQNTERASLCETAMTIDVVAKLKKMCEVKRDSAFVDARLWKYARENNIPNFLYSDKRYVIGIKGMPGRYGIGVGHRAKSYRKDPYWEMLTKLIGEDDADWYKRLVEVKRLHRQD